MSPKAPTLPALRVDSQSFPKRLLLSPLRLPPPQPVLPSLHHGARAPAPPQGPTTGNQRPTSPPQRTPPLCPKPSAPRPHQPAPPRGPLPHSQPAAPGGGGGGCPRACATATLQGEGSRGGTCPQSHPTGTPPQPPQCPPASPSDGPHNHPRVPPPVPAPPGLPADAPLPARRRPPSPPQPSPARPRRRCRSRSRRRPRPAPANANGAAGGAAACRAGAAGRDRPCPGKPRPEPPFRRATGRSPWWGAGRRGGSALGPGGDGPARVWCRGPSRVKDKFRGLWKEGAKHPYSRPGCSGPRRLPRSLPAALRAVRGRSRPARAGGAGVPARSGSAAAWSLSGENTAPLTHPTVAGAERSQTQTRFVQRLREAAVTNLQNHSQRKVEKIMIQSL